MLYFGINKDVSLLFLILFMAANGKYQISDIRFVRNIPELVSYIFRRSDSMYLYKHLICNLKLHYRIKNEYEINNSNISFTTLFHCDSEVIFI